MPKIMRILAVAAFVAAGNGMPARVHAEPVAAAPSTAKLERLSGFFENEVTTGKLAGAIVLIQQHGLPVYFKRFGVQDVATKQPMTPDTIFALHSMTKRITNLAAMMLIDEGKLALDDPVSKYIPAFAAVKVGVESETNEGQPVLSLVPTDRSVSIEDLMRHTSGISYDYIGGVLIRQAYSQAHLLDGHVDNSSCRPHSRSTTSPTAGNPLALRLFDRCSRTGHRNRFRKIPLSIHEATHLRPAWNDQHQICA